MKEHGLEFDRSNQKSSLVMYGNLLINSQLKLEMLRFTFPLWHQYWKSPSYIRLRGEFSEEASKFLEQYADCHLALGSRFHQWRRQTAFDLEFFNCEYVFQLLEDHMPCPEIATREGILNELLSGNVDVLQYSWFKSYEPLGQLLIEYGAERNKSLLSVKIDKKTSRVLKSENHLYYVSLTSIFRKSFYIDLLRSQNPIIRRYDPHAPFDVEQKPRQKWYMPLHFGLPQNEMGICLDDDHLVVGSSAASRGLFIGANRRETITHHGKNSLRNSLYKATSEKLEMKLPHAYATLLNKVISGMTTFFDTFFYSIKARILNVLDSRIEKITSRD